VYDDLDGETNNAGSARIFVRSNGTWTQEAFLTAATPAAGEEFGSSVAFDATGTRVIPLCQGSCRLS
jgi:hypothetical protein